MATGLQAASDLRMAIRRIWQDALGIHEIADDAVFFELGGYSLLAVQVVSIVSEEFNLGDRLEVVSIFMFPVLEDFILLIENLLQEVPDVSETAAAAIGGPGDEI